MALYLHPLLVDMPATTPAGESVSRASTLISNGIKLFSVDGGVGGVQPGGGFATDLAQAQAQLQSLQQFRAAAGGHHQKMPSFSFPNMLPNMMAANMMGLGLGGINLLQQQQQQFQRRISSASPPTPTTPTTTAGEGRGVRCR